MAIEKPKSLLFKRPKRVLVTERKTIAPKATMSSLEFKIKLMDKMKLHSLLLSSLTARKGLAPEELRQRWLKLLLNTGYNAKALKAKGFVVGNLAPLFSAENLLRLGFSKSELEPFRKIPQWNYAPQVFAAATKRLKK